MFLLPQGEGSVEGTSDGNPIRLAGIAKDEFRCLLRALLYRQHGTSRLPLGITEWTAVLKLSTLWEFDKLRKAAISSLHGICLNAIDRVVLSKQYNINEWLLPALNELARRPESISFEEASRLGFEIALNLASVRESVKLQDVNATLNFPHKNNGGFVINGGNHHSCTTKTLAVGPRDRETQNLDFTGLIRTKFKIPETTVGKPAFKIRFN
ncbi:hypothetical protein ID866_11570 [Astraeus odoratus]|nr:hypothetical protein ID866_11570 [Astraeus odoratus]